MIRRGERDSILGGLGGATQDGMRLVYEVTMPLSDPLETHMTAK
jgi:hypothetical protein